MNRIPNWKLKEIAKKDERFIRQYYTRVRKEALRRLSVLERNNMIDYIDNVPEITQARGQSFNSVYDEVIEINTFLSNPFSKITFVKKFEKEIIETLEKSSYYNINKSNIREFNYFMKKVKGSADLASVIYDPDRTIEIFDEAKRLNLDYTPEELYENYDYMKKNLEVISEIKPVKGNKPMSQKELRKRVTQWKNGNRS